MNWTSIVLFEASTPGHQGSTVEFIPGRNSYARNPAAFREVARTVALVCVAKNQNGGHTVSVHI